MSSAALAVPSNKLTGLKAILEGGVSASITFEVTGPDGVATTAVVNSAEHRDRLAQLWVAAHTLPKTSPDPLAATRAACNVLGKQAVLWREAAELAKEEEGLNARKAALAAKQATLSSPPPPPKPATSPPGAGNGSAGAAATAGPEGVGKSSGRQSGGTKRGAKAAAAAAAPANEEEEQDGEDEEGAEGKEEEEEEEDAAITPSGRKSAAGTRATPPPAKRPKLEVKIGGVHVTKEALDAAVAQESSWAGVGRTLACSGSTVTTKLWRTWAKWHQGEELPIASPRRGRARAPGGAASGAKTRHGRKATPVPSASRHPPPEASLLLDEDMF